MGFLCPITLTPKLLIQKTWLLKIGWDTNIPEDIGKEFYSWIDDLSLLSSIIIPRALDINGNESLSLHTFCDATKSRVSSLRKMTINRLELELLSCCIGVRLAALALQTLNLDNVPRNYWTDSSTALSWIQRDDHWAPFVANRTWRKKLWPNPDVEELDIVEKKLVKIVQQEAFSSEEPLKGHFTFRHEEGIIRSKTKILRRHDDENFRRPIVLPSKHELVERMIQDYHLQLLHAGIQVLLTNIRQKFWIIKGRKTVQRVISKCVRCKRHSAKALNTVPCPLPEDRVRDAYAFEVTGVDVAGPLYLKENRKAWILLFTCEVYCAVHLELIESLSTNRFFSRI
ncbi:uncharacterized protein LOC118195535 [Stegodyphus dumicola]|uniref:uncharacterized protein LOC118195535 n=1 Tax=Stegodyphus dumicola TaxID=202533 RepID=UPI0015B37CCB|nr:uncharacterized protein LOC118195535 [Stegodyphus dumicola]